jgi:hypothetical protein
MSERRFPMDSPETLAVQVEGGLEVVIKVEMGVLSVNVTAPGVIDPTVFVVDEDGDAKVAFFANGRHQVTTDVHQGPGAIVGNPCQYSPRHKMDGAVPATTTIDCGPVGIVPACQACADLYVRLSR